MTARNMADGIGHRHDRQAEGQRHAEKADADLREPGRDHRAAAAAESQPEGANSLGRQFPCVHHVALAGHVDSMRLRCHHLFAIMSGKFA